MKDTKYKIVAYFDNQSYRKLFNEVNSDYAENLQILLHNLSLFSYDVLIIGVIIYKENISNIISAIRKITQIPIIILTDASSLLCMSWKKELIYAGADCIMDINSTTEEIEYNFNDISIENEKNDVINCLSKKFSIKNLKLDTTSEYPQNILYLLDRDIQIIQQVKQFLYIRTNRTSRLKPLIDVLNENLKCREDLYNSLSCS